MKKKIFKLFFITSLSVFLFIGMAYAYLSFTTAKAANLSVLQDGDIIFQTTGNTQSKAILLATGSYYTHMGIIKKTDDNNYVVVEAVGPVKETPLDEWIERGIAERITIMRMPGLSNAKIQQVLSNAEPFYGRGYDIHFSFDNEEMYCSELVYEAYKEAGIILGKVEKFKELNLNNAAAKNVIERRWKTYPLCKEVKEFEQCYEILLEQSLITPVAIAEDEKLELIYSNYPL